MKAAFSITTLLTLVGCADYNMVGRDDSGLAPYESGWGTEDTDSSDSASPDARWFAMDAEFTVVAGQVGELTLTHRVYPEDVASGLICSSERELVGLAVLEQTPDPVVWHWLELDTGDDAGDCPDSAGVPTHLRLGLGEFYPELVPALTDTELQADHLYGAYASFEEPTGDGLDGTTYAYGYAGTPANRAGEEPAVAQGPLPDGVYSATAWYVFGL